MREEVDFSPFESAEDVENFIRETRTWGQYGDEDQVGALNLIDQQQRVAAAGLVREGEVVSLGRPLATDPGPGNPRPVLHLLDKADRVGGAGVSRDYISLGSHGTNTTHLDALCHVWGGDGMWGGVDPHGAIQFGGARWGAIDHWRAGIFTRGVLFDIPKHRSGSYVTSDTPVTAAELEEVRNAEGIELEPGDAIAVYSGRDKFDAENPVYGSDSVQADESTRPGLDVSCLKFVQHYQVSTLLWDMTDNRPIPFGMAYGVHAAIYAYGMALIDSSELADLSRKCAELARSEFLLVTAPLYLRGGTASPVNPLAIF